MEQELREKLERVREAARRVYATGVKPRTGSYGIEGGPEGVYQTYSPKGCCMVGAAMVGMPSPDLYASVREQAQKVYGLTADQVFALVSGFDGTEVEGPLEVYAFAREFAKAVKPSSL